MAGYWPSSVSACSFTEMESMSINSQKEKQSQYQAILSKQALPIKNLLYDFWGNFCCGTRLVVPFGQDRSILPAQVANHRA